MVQNMFGNYQPKRSPDTIHDYIGQWVSKSGSDQSSVFDKIPEATLENLKVILDLLEKFKKESCKYPGTIIKGNVILGAPPQEYVPSAPELIASELGNAAMSIIKATPPGELKAWLKKHPVKPKKITFVSILFSHVDVMGSGRFFHAEKGREMVIEI
jgi:hypothetical protein